MDAAVSKSSFCGNSKYVGFEPRLTRSLDPSAVAVGCGCALENPRNISTLALPGFHSFKPRPAWSGVALPVLATFKSS